jgi:pyruvate/2-oxoglutarate dehydrogenase complex dihydrolipoamide acyltransferase (E2) component
MSAVIPTGTVVNEARVTALDETRRQYGATKYGRETIVLLGLDRDAQLINVIHKK